MKKFALKTLNGIGWVVTSSVAGYLFGRIFNILFRGIWTEKVKETKPVLFWGTAVLYYILLTGFTVAWTTVLPVVKIYDWIDSKIDDLADEKEWD